MENKKINIAELLKDCPKGMELDCTMYDNVTFERFDVEQNRCYFKAGPADTFWTTCYGKVNGSPFGKCVIFPKGKSTWEGFVPPYEFKVGDCVVHHKYGKGDITQILWLADEIVYEAHFVNFTTYCKSNELCKYELVSNKFDVTTLQPFDKVLIRDTVKEIWKPDFFGCLYDSNDCPYMVVGGIRWKYCIPYKGNEYLLGTVNDCNEYFKNWE